jgi:glutamate dehydrogenase
MKHVLDNYPRNELFQIDIKDLKEHAEGINRLNHRPDVDVFIREDILQRYFSVLVYLPKEEYDTKLRLKVQAVLQQELKGTVAAHYITVDEKPLARLLYMIATEELLLSDYDVENIRTKLIDVCTPWQDALKREVLKNFSKKDSQRLLRSLTNSFSISYQDQVSPKHAVEDLEPLQKVLYEREMLATLYHRESDNDNEYRVKIYKRGEEASLSDLLPILDRMGFHCLYEYSYLVKPSDNLPDVWIHDLVGTIDVLDKEHIDDIQPLFAETFEMCWHKKVDSDSYNSLILSARLTWREANLFRALGRYLDLARYPLGKRYISQVLTKYAQITRILCDIFLLFHDPKLDRENANQQANELILEFNNKLDSVEKIDEDRILRSMLTLIENILRTNYFHPDSTVDLSDVLIFKFNASNLKDLPQPRPYREIFIFGPRVEAVHLRGGPIARGGIRWSDRFEDFRTEVLGLVKAQMVKNAVIVPVGAKGGFICKNMSAFKTPQERQQEGIACYQIMIRSLLSITDNIIDGQVVYPNHTVRRDQDDPYLVVAADKGTATFSDIANKISVDHGFWLGDAFASGGSKGYDHKAMGITARGAWECIKRHFRELGKDIQKEEFVVAGVGDMSGDVFGNGMILSPFTKLVAAFDHRHIFVDPNPDLKKSFAERKRLFEKPGSSWMDYDTKIMSKGAMIYNRQDKSLTLTPEIQALLDIQQERVTPSALMQAILRSKVELLYFGGIGTYIKSSQQTHEQVGDKGNDPQRINASELRCKVVGEGANLAITQLARIEFAQHGGKINTDFIDNSAGVDTSDHEVNIKILLQPMVRAEKLSDSERDKLLVAMTNDVAQHVLKNNYDQSLALSLLERRADEELAMHAQFMRHLEHEDLLNREIEDLPDDESIQRLLQRHVGLTRPELAVILAYSKMTFFTQLMRSSLPDDVALTHQAVEYFPDLIIQKYQSDIINHKLKRDIIATEVANVMINRMGPTFASNIMESSTFSAADVATAWLIVRNVFGLRELWEQIDALDNILPTTLQMSLYEKIITIMEDGVKWFLLHHGHELSITKLVPLYREQLQDLVKSVDIILPESLKEQREERQLLFNNLAIKDDLKAQLINLPLLMDCCDIILIQQKHSAKAVDVANIYFALSDRLHIATLNGHLEALPAESSWVEEVIDGLQEDTHTLLSSITQKFLLDRLSAKDIEKWVVQNQEKIMAIDTMLGDIARMGDADLSLLTVAVKRLNRLKEVM